MCKHGIAQLLLRHCRFPHLVGYDEAKVPGKKLGTACKGFFWSVCHVGRLHALEKASRQEFYHNAKRDDGSTSLSPPLIRCWNWGNGVATTPMCPHEVKSDHPLCSPRGEYELSLVLAPLSLPILSLTILDWAGVASLKSFYLDQGLRCPSQEYPLSYGGLSFNTILKRLVPISGTVPPFVFRTGIIALARYVVPMDRNP
eukprot:scaffold420_cov342-Pavlova_lutheri.AAC.1